MDSRTLDFLATLDQLLLPHALPGERFDVYGIGRSALMLHYGFQSATNDFDIVGRENRQELEQKALEFLGKGTAAAQKLGLYLETVPPGLPPLPGGFQKRCVEIAGEWKVIRLWKLEIHDLATTKLKSFRSKDREDLQALCDRGLLEPEKLRSALEAAFPWRSPKAEDQHEDPDNPDASEAFRNLDRVVDYLNGAISSLG